MQKMVIDPLIQSIQNSIIKKDTQHPLFHGSWDWHSAVHGHWALLHFARIEKKTQLLGWLRNRFSSSALSQEFQCLQDNPEFEKPYGRAWFLAMSIAYLQADMPEQIQSKSHLIALDLWNDCLSLTPDSQIGEYRNHCWALLQLYMWFSFVKEKEKQQEIQYRVEQYYCDFPNHPSQDQHRAEFFSCWGVQALLIGQVLGRKPLRQWLKRQSFSKESLGVVTDLRNAHHLGMNASRAWGLWAAWKATEVFFWKETYDAHIQASMDLHRHWKDDHRSYGHWVPQFSLYARYLESIHQIERR